MAQIKRQNRGTSSGDLANVSGGYVASGESEHSRRAAHGKIPTQFKGRGPLHTPGARTLYQLIGETERQIEFLECELKIEDNRTRRAKLAKNIEIKGKFLTRLRVEAEGLRNG